MSWRFKLCGQDGGPRVKVARPTLDDKHADALRLGFSIPKDEKLHFHFDDEDCKKLRPFKDLYERWTLEKVDGRVIFLHSKAPLRVASRPKVERDNGSEEPVVDKADSNKLQVLFEGDELSQAETEAEKKDAVSDDNEQPEVRSQADKDSDEQHDVSENTQQSQVETQAGENSDAGNEAQGEPSATTAEPQDIAGQKYMVLIQGGMHPHAISTSPMINTDHQCKIRFRVEQHKTLDRDWSNIVGLQQNFMTIETALLRDLPGMIKGRLKYRRIIFRLSVVVQAYGRFAIDLHDPKYGLRFRTIQDGLVVPGMEESQLEFVVRAESTEVDRPTDRSERRASKAALEIIGENEMIQAIPLDEKVNSSVFRHVGNYETVNTGSHPSNLKGDASIFGDELVRDVRNGESALTSMTALKDYDLAPQYIVKASKVLNKTNLFALIREASPPTDDLEKLPILPPLSFNLFPTGASDPTADESPHSQVSGHSQRSSDSMTAVVRFVNHLTSDKGRELVFYNNTEIEFDEPDTYATAEEAVITSIEEQREEYNGWDSFKPDSTIPGSLQLFVRPQLPAPQKLFRIPTTGEGSDAKMIGFLSPQEVNKGMRVVYMEAHVWPKE
ncbi:hypothetical protein D0869_12922 [Hortaea werneckii]|uniref:Uncharacterized protein n=1 Tax=Hortaea werneckii TaxID=91943 RepID=A0A3M6YHG6_HORWE|nr:hypothetical protein D0869_12922 [Hortaea werneckii]RMY02505.1 hypothetical protein D0868_07931 [Hortaea werneckii]